MVVGVIMSVSMDVCCLSQQICSCRRWLVCWEAHHGLNTEVETFSTHHGLNTAILQPWLVLVRSSDVMFHCHTLVQGHVGPGKRSSVSDKPGNLGFPPFFWVTLTRFWWVSCLKDKFPGLCLLQCNVLLCFGGAKAFQVHFPISS